MPIGASIAMLISLFVALTITPYLGYIFLREKDKKTEDKESQKSEMLTRKISLWQRLKFTDFTRKR